MLYNQCKNNWLFKPNNKVTLTVLILVTLFSFSAGVIYSTISNRYLWHKALEHNFFALKVQPQKAYIPTKIIGYGRFIYSQGDKEELDIMMV